MSVKVKSHTYVVNTFFYCVCVCVCVCVLHVSVHSQCVFVCVLLILGSETTKKEMRKYIHSNSVLGARTKGQVQGPDLMYYAPAQQTTHKNL